MQLGPQPGVKMSDKEASAKATFDSDLLDVWRRCAGRAKEDLARYANAFFCSVERQKMMPELTFYAPLFLACHNYRECLSMLMALELYAATMFRVTVLPDSSA